MRDDDNCTHPDLDDLWDNEANVWTIEPARLCDDCLQALHDATCGCDDRVSEATAGDVDEGDPPMPVVGRDVIIAHVKGA